ncbi:MAG: carboxypeptidase-like regulatory domain-containing protein, partial [Acidobacteriota bacterium]|nr:carboxypeptidase-like regulatory domain-containing protein [Acidobacteriota bacterium]
MKHLRSMCVLAGLLLALSLSAYSQAVTGALVGTVNDASGAAMPSAKITITEVNTGISRSVQTNESGNYSFSDLPPGTYTIL